MPRHKIGIEAKRVSFVLKKVVQLIRFGKTTKAFVERVRFFDNLFGNAEFVQKSDEKCFAFSREIIIRSAQFIDQRMPVGFGIRVPQQSSQKPHVIAVPVCRNNHIKILNRQRVFFQLTHEFVVALVGIEAGIHQSQRITLNQKRIDGPNGKGRRKWYLYDVVFVQKGLKFLVR